MTKKTRNSIVRRQIAKSEEDVKPTYTTSQSPDGQDSIAITSNTARRRSTFKHDRQMSTISDIQIELAEDILEIQKNGCGPCFRAWLCDAKRNAGVEIFLYIAFFTSLIFLAMDVKGSTVTFFYSNLVEDVIIHEEFESSHIRKDFTQIGEVGEFWQFIHGPFANSMFKSRENICVEENREAGCTSERASLFYNDFVLLDVRFKQNRVKRHDVNSSPYGRPSLCRVPKWIEKINADAWNAILEQGCYPPYSINYEETDNNFNRTGPFHDEIADCFKYKKRLFDWTTTGTIYPYPYSPSGYTCYLETSSRETKNATKWLHHLEQSDWFNAGTRMVMIDFTLYSANIDTFLFFRLGVEQAPTGGLSPFWDNYAIDMGDEVSSSTLTFRIILGLFCMIFFTQEISECCNHGCKTHCSDIWNMLETLNLFLFFTYFGLLLASELTLIHERETQTFDIQSIGAMRTFADNVLALNVVISSIKVFKYIKVSRRMSLMLTTFYQARYSLFALLILVLIFLVGYAMAFYLAFGHRIAGFRSFSRSFKTLANSLLADFEYQEDLERVNWLLGPLMYFSFQIFVSFVLLSLLIAIIEDAFQTTQHELEENMEKDELVSAMRETGHQMWSTTIGRFSNSISRARTSSFVGWVPGRKSKTENQPESKTKMKDRTKSGTELTDLGDVVNRSLGKDGKSPRKVNHKFLQAVIASGKQEKEKDKKQEEKNQKKRRMSTSRFPVPETSSDNSDEKSTSKTKGDLNDAGEMVAYAMGDTNVKINLLENKMDMILASLDSIGKLKPMTEPVVPRLAASASKDHKKISPVHEKTRKSRRSSSTLPPNWKKYRDEETQQVYYNNTATDEVTWDKPEGPLE